MHFNRASLLAFAALVSMACPWVLAEAPTNPTAEEAAIRNRAKEYLLAVQRGDGEEIAAFWTAEGDYVDASGQAFKGRWLARQKKLPRENDGDSPRLAATVESIRFITPEVAIEDGALKLTHTPVAGPAEATVLRFTAIWRNHGGAWLLEGVRESSVLAAGEAGRLSGLEWMLGDWVSDDEGNTVRLSCAWSTDKHFLLREIDVSFPARGPLHVTQRIGWDAHEKQIRSWAFDSEGGHGDGLWFLKEGRWIVEASCVLPNGSLATGTNTYTPRGDDAFVWKSRNAEIDGDLMPDREVRMVRKKASD